MDAGKISCKQDKVEIDQHAQYKAGREELVEKSCKMYLTSGDADYLIEQKLVE